MSREAEQNAILRELLRRTRDLEAPPDRKCDLRRWEDAVERGPAWSGPQWFPHLATNRTADQTELRRLRRAIVDLERRQLVVTWGPGTSRTKWIGEPGGRMTHIRITPEGRERAERLERREALCLGG